jgi:hypothetical protein
MVKPAQPGLGGRYTPFSFHSTVSTIKLWCTLQPLFLLYPNMHSVAVSEGVSYCIYAVSLLFALSISASPNTDMHQLREGRRRVALEPLMSTLKQDHNLHFNHNLTLLLATFFFKRKIFNTQDKAE